MKFQKLLNEIRYGVDTIEVIEEKDKILACMNEETNSLIISQFLKEKISLIKEEKEDNKIVSYFNKIQKKFEEFEDKYFNETISKAYRRMKLSSIAEDYNTIINLLEDKRMYKEFEVKDLSKVLSTIKYGVRMYSENENILFMNKPQNPMFSILLKEDEDFLGNVLE